MNEYIKILKKQAEAEKNDFYGGQPESFEARNLIWGFDYYFAIKVRDSIGQESPIRVIFLPGPPPMPC